MKADDLFVKINFRPSQLDAIRRLYYTHLLPKIDTSFEFSGKAIAFIWDQKTQWNVSNGYDIYHTTPGYSVHECINDELWNEFADLRPYMGTSGLVTILPPGEVIVPHIDRKWRSNAIYFPVSGCNEFCYNDCYDLPKLNMSRVQTLKHIEQACLMKNKYIPDSVSNPKPVYTYNINTAAYLMNVHEWHGVRNEGNDIRVVFGWNFKFNNGIPIHTFDECKEILHNLGYIK